MRAVTLVLTSLVSLCASAEIPDGDLDLKTLSYWAGSVPKCVEIGGGNSICTWQAPEDTYLTCISRFNLPVIARDDCVYESLKDRLNQYAKLKKGGDRHRDWENNVAYLKREIGIDSNLLRIVKVVGHGPSRCIVTDSLTCAWETDNDSPGHLDALQQLSKTSYSHQIRNKPRRLLCDFDVTTFKREELECLMTAD